MKDNRISVVINKPVEEVFEFSTNPKNTSSWVEGIVGEETNEWPVKIGSIYRNQNRKGEWREHTVSDFQQNRIFELLSKDGNYHVHYSYKDLGNSCELEYYEWVENGELADTVTKHTLQKLKTAMEK